MPPPLQLITQGESIAPMSARTFFLIGLLLVGCGKVVDPPGDGTGSGEAPTNVTAAANIDRGVRLSWTAPAGTITGYTVTASPADGMVRVVGTSALVTGLSVGQAYRFTVKAMTAAGPSRDSEPSNEITAVAGPAAPTGVSGCGADRQVTIGGSQVLGATGYNIYYDTAPGVTKLARNMMTAPSLPFTLPGLTNASKLYYVVAAVDANRVESVDSAEDSATPDAVIHDVVFGHSYAGGQQSIEIVDCVSKVAQNSTPPARLIKGASAGIVTSYYNQIALDPDRALVYYRNPGGILVFSDATKAAGDLTPLRSITGTATGLSGGGGIALDTTRDVLYVLNSGTSILQFANVSASNGNVGPAKIISGTATTLTSNASALAIDTTNDRLYVSNYTNVLVFHNASAMAGNVIPTRTITLGGGATLTSFGVAVDVANDQLYIGSRNTGAIYAVRASTANGAVTPSRTLTGLNVPMGVAVAQNRLFMMSDNNANQFFGWNNAVNVNGQVAPDIVFKFPSLVATAGFAYAP
jgi:hypothetical protein